MPRASALLAGIRATPSPASCSGACITMPANARHGPDSRPFARRGDPERLTKAPDFFRIARPLILRLSSPECAPDVLRPHETIGPRRSLRRPKGRAGGVPRTMRGPLSHSDEPGPNRSATAFVQARGCATGMREGLALATRTTRRLAARREPVPACCSEMGAASGVAFRSPVRFAG